MDNVIQKLKSAARAVGNLFSSAASTVKYAAIRVHDYLGTSATIASVLAVAATVAMMFVDPTGISMVVGAVIFAFNVHRLPNVSFGQLLLLLGQSLAMGILVAYMPLFAVGLAAYIYGAYRFMGMDPAEAWSNFWDIQIMNNQDSPFLEGMWVLFLGWLNTTIDLVFHPAIVHSLHGKGYRVRDGQLFQTTYVYAY
jgi:hypothetical protein